MAVKKSNLVNLDAMIAREDFSITKTDGMEVVHDKVMGIGLRDLKFSEDILDNLFGSSLRKPDFQRETNHWSPAQIVSLLECFINGDLIPSVILWQSPSGCIFVIDGGHRLSVLRAWLADDYGDQKISQEFFDYNISQEQLDMAEKTRKLINSKIGSYKDIAKNQKEKLGILATRTLPIQWVNGDVTKAETSFFKINTKGTPLDDTEELLLRNRKKPASISARAILRAGTGHKYWSIFNDDNMEKIEDLAKDIHNTLFTPELKSPIKTLDLPLGGSRNVRTAIQILIDLIMVANNQFKQKTANINTNNKNAFEQLDDDISGEETIRYLTSLKKLVGKVTGNIDGSLGLHPAIYFYSSTGKHYTPMFMGTMMLIGNKLHNNDKNFFIKFTSIRSRLEKILIENKEFIVDSLQKKVSNQRNKVYQSFLEKLVQRLNESVDDIEIHEISVMLDVKNALFIQNNTLSQNFSDEVKSQTFIIQALNNACKCPICNGYLHTEKSIQYDHITEKSQGGIGGLDNCQLIHPFCNQVYKNRGLHNKEILLIDE